MQDQGDDKSIIKIEEADENTQDGNAQLVESNLTQNTNTASKKEDWKNSILLKTITFGANGFFFAGHLVLNGKYLSTLGPYGASASSLMSTYQSVILGSGVGFLLGTGLDFGMALGKKEYETAGDVAKTATILSSILGGFSASAMFSTRGIFPLIFEANTAKIASDFFTGYAVASFPILFVIMGQQVALQEGDWYVPPASMLFILAGSGVSSYLLGFTADMGAIGIGLGGTVGSSLVAIGMGSWFFRKNYGKYNLYKCHVKGFSEKMKSLLSLGWKLAFQRLTEWGNLLAITTLIGIKNNDHLKALNPAMLYLVLFGTAQQGVAQAAGMIISKNKGAIQKALQSGDTAEILSCHKNNIQTIFRSNIFGLVLNSAIASSFYLARVPLTKLFLSENTSEEITEFAEDLLWLNMLGLIPDAGRIIGAGALRGWKDLLFPTIVSFVLMTVIGVSVAYGCSLFYDETELMIYVRDVAMTISAAIILGRCHNQVKNDEEELREHIPNPPPFFGTGLTFFRSPKSTVSVEEVKDEIQQTVEQDHSSLQNYGSLHITPSINNQ